MREARLNLTAAEIHAYQAGERVIKRRVKPMASQKWLEQSTLDASPGGYGFTHDGRFWWQFYHPLAGKFAFGVQNAPDSPLTCIRSPFGQPGDRLVLREAWCPVTHGSYVPWHQVRKAPEHNTDAFIQYKADYWRGSTDYDSYWRSSTQMPRWAVRYTPTVRTVRVEQIDGAWWWICELEEMNAIDSRKEPIV